MNCNLHFIFHIYFKLITTTDEVYNVPIKQLDAENAINSRHKDNQWQQKIVIIVLSVKLDIDIQMNYIRYVVTK